MADNIPTIDRDGNPIDLAAKDIGGVLFPRNILTKPDGTDIDPASADNQATTNASLATLVAALSDPATATLQGTLASLLTEIGALLTSLDGKTTAVDTGDVTVAASALPDGAATETTLAAQSLKLPASLGPKAGAASLSVVESAPTTVTIVSLQTDSSGSGYSTFGSQSCEQLDIVNTAVGAVDLEVRRGGAGNTIVVPAGSSRMFVGLSNASGLEVRRLDQSIVQVTFTAEAIKA